MAGWEDIRAEVLSRIRSKAWPLGTLIPGEEALAQDFGVARATVNRALSELARAGVLERKRKAGTRVAALPVRKATLDIPVIRAEVEARGEAYGLRLLGCSEGVHEEIHAIRSRRGQHHPLVRQIVASAGEPPGG